MGHWECSLGGGRDGFYLGNQGPFWESDMDIKSFDATFHWANKYTLFVLQAIFKESFPKALLSVMGEHKEITVKEHKGWCLCGVWVLAPCLKVDCFSSSDRLGTVSHCSPNMGQSPEPSRSRPAWATQEGPMSGKKGNKSSRGILCSSNPQASVSSGHQGSWPQILWNCQPVTWNPQ